MRTETTAAGDPAPPSATAAAKDAREEIPGRETGSGMRGWWRRLGLVGFGGWEEGGWVGG